MRIVAVLPLDYRKSLTLKLAPQSDVSDAAKCVVALADAKRQCRAEDFSDDDTYLTALIAVATAHLDGAGGILGRALLSQQWELRLDCFPLCIQIPLPPLKQIDSIIYVAADGSTPTLDPANYQVVLNGEQASMVRPAYSKCWPSHQAVPDAVRISFTCGWTDGNALPPPIRHAARLLVKHWYDNREIAIVPDQGANALLNVPKSADALLAPYVASWF